MSGDGGSGSSMSRPMLAKSTPSNSACNVSSSHCPLLMLDLRMMSSRSASVSSLYTTTGTAFIFRRRAAFRRWLPSSTTSLSVQSWCSTAIGLCSQKPLSRIESHRRLRLACVIFRGLFGSPVSLDGGIHCTAVHFILPPCFDFHCHFPLLSKFGSKRMLSRIISPRCSASISAFSCSLSSGVSTSGETPYSSHFCLINSSISL